MKSGHTQGKWRVKESGGCVCAPNVTICQLVHIDDGWLSIDREVEANAKLISAAPQLLEVCKDVKKWLSNGSFKYGETIKAEHIGLLMRLSENIDGVVSLAENGGE